MENLGVAGAMLVVGESSFGGTVFPCACLFGGGGGTRFLGRLVLLLHVPVPRASSCSWVGAFSSSVAGCGGGGVPSVVVFGLLRVAWCCRGGLSGRAALSVVGVLLSGGGGGAALGCGGGSLLWKRMWMLVSEASSIRWMMSWSLLFVKMS